MNRKLNQHDLRRNMHGKVAIVKHQTFMDAFVPLPPSTGRRTRKPRSRVFADMEVPKSEKEMYREIPERLNKKPRPCAGFVVVSTPHKGDKKAPTSIAPDCGVYPYAHRPTVEDATQYGRTDWSYMEITFECKVDIKDDPFDDASHNGEPISQSRKDTLGQLLTYAELVFHNQHRAFQYMVIFLGTWARIVRIDRSGIFATDRFNYRTQEKKLTEFLWRYARLSPVQRGHDTTVIRINPSSPRETIAHMMREKLNAAKGHVAEIFRASLNDNYPWWKLQVPDEKTGKVLWYVVAKPHFQAPGVRGRGTRCYVAVELKEDGTLGDFVYLKDAWRVKHDDIEKEGTTLQRLNDGKVPNVPTLVSHGDLPGQVTQSPAKWRELFPERSHCPLKEHQHYRLVVKEIGKPLSQFTNGGELIMAMLHILEAHKAACELHIIHRDISAGNILLVQDKDGKWKGMLTDWELAKDTEKTSDARQLERTGTWQFMSAHLQNDPRRVVVIPDELESVFHVIIFYSVRFLHHNLSDSNVGHFLFAYFDASFSHFHGESAGLSKLMAVKTGELSLESYRNESDPILRFIWPPNQPPAANQTPPPADYGHPLNDIIDELLEWFQAHYALDKIATAPVPSNQTPADRSNAVVPLPMEADESAKAPPPTARSSKPDRTARIARNLQTHDPMMALLRRELGRNWPANDKTKDKRPKDGYNPDRDPESSSDSSSSYGSSDSSQGAPFEVHGGDVAEDDVELVDDAEDAMSDVEEEDASGSEDGEDHFADETEGEQSTQPTGSSLVPASSTSSLSAFSGGPSTSVATRSSRKRQADELLLEPVSPKSKRSRAED